MSDVNVRKLNRLREAGFLDEYQTLQAARQPSKQALFAPQSLSLARDFRFLSSFERSTPNVSDLFLLHRAACVKSCFCVYISRHSRCRWDRPCRRGQGVWSLYEVGQVQPYDKANKVIRL
jgi:hypothetical protein